MHIEPTNKTNEEEKNVKLGTDLQVVEHQIKLVAPVGSIASSALGDEGRQTTQNLLVLCQNENQHSITSTLPWRVGRVYYLRAWPGTVCDSRGAKGSSEVGGDEGITNERWSCTW